MPTDERILRVTERCFSHPHRAAVARCNACGRRLCLICAVPVRGRVLGPECVDEALGADDAVIVTDAPPPKGRPSRIAGLFLPLAVASTFLPWTRFAPGSGFLDAWSRSPQWSMLAAPAAVVALAVWGLGVVWRAFRPPAWLLAALLLLVTAGSIMAIVNPPPFAGSSAGPWVALAGGLGGTASVAARAGARRTRGI